MAIFFFKAFLLCTAKLYLSSFFLRYFCMAGTNSFGIRWVSERVGTLAGWVREGFQVLHVTSCSPFLVTWIQVGLTEKLLPAALSFLDIIILQGYVLSFTNHILLWFCEMSPLDFLKPFPGLFSSYLRDSALSNLDVTSSLGGWVGPFNYSYSDEQ